MDYYTLGDEVVAFSEKFIRQTKGRWAGQPLRLERWQRKLIEELYLTDENGRPIYREALIGVARKNGKSTLCASIALYGLLGALEAGAEVYSAAASKDQARIVFDQARDFVEASPELRRMLKPQRSAIICESTGGIYRVLSSDAPLQHGLNPSLVVIDELHAHPSPELYYALTTGQLARENPMVVSITTAGFELDTICGTVYERGMKLLEEGGEQAMRDAGFLFQWFKAPDNCALHDERAWKKANPSSWITVPDLRRECERLPENVFRRLHLNQWTHSEEAWLPPGAWEDCYEEGVEIPEGAPICIGVDIGTQHDSSAVVRAWKRPEDERIVVEAEVFLPEGKGQALELPKVEAAIYRNAERYHVIGCAYDPWTFERSAQDLKDRGMPMEVIPQTPERMAPISQDLYESIVQRHIAHNGDPVLAAHVRAGATKEHERGWRLVKGKSRNVIDALIALALAHSLLAEPEAQPMVAFV